jgi:hypothetical protein
MIPAGYFLQNTLHAKETVLSVLGGNSGYQSKATSELADIRDEKQETADAYSKKYNEGKDKLIDYDQNLSLLKNNI